MYYTYCTHKSYILVVDLTRATLPKPRARPQGFLMYFAIFDTCECEMIHVKSARPQYFRTLNVLFEKWAEFQLP